MVILGIDPGSTVTGYGLIERQGRQTRMLDYGCIRTTAKDPLAWRLKCIYDGLTAIISRYQPDAVVVEETFYGRNAKAAITMGHARGVALLAAANGSGQVVEYAPREIKQSIVGSGSASKTQIQFMVKTILKLPEGPKPEDAADALAIALCHANRLETKAWT